MFLNFFTSFCPFPLYSPSSALSSFYSFSTFHFAYFDNLYIPFCLYGVKTALIEGRLFVHFSGILCLICFGFVSSTFTRLLYHVLFPLRNPYPLVFLLLFYLFTYLIRSYSLTFTQSHQHHHDLRSYSPPLNLYIWFVPASILGVEFGLRSSIVQILGDVLSELRQ